MRFTTVRCLFHIDISRSATTLLLAFSMFLPPRAPAQNSEVAYVSNAGAAVSAYAVGANGATVTQLNGSPYTNSGGLSTRLAVHPSRRFLYVADGLNSTVSISTYSIDASGKLQQLGSPVALNPGPPSNLSGQTLYLAMDPKGRFLYAAVVWGWPSNVYGWTIDQNTGALAPITGGVPAAAGSHADSHAFCATVDPSGRFLYVCNQDDGTVSTFAMDLTTGALSGGQQTQTGLRPRSISIDPTGRFAYVVNYGVNPPNICQGVYAYGTGQGCVVRIFTIDQNTGVLTSIGANDTVPTGTNPVWSTIDPLGQVLYVVNIDSDDISAFAIDAVTGGLTLIGTYATGSGPYSIDVGPTGQFVYVANVVDGSTYVYARDGAGALTLTTVLAGTSATDVATVLVGPLYVASVLRPVSPDGSSVFNANRGVIPIKFGLQIDGVATCQLPPATIALTRTAGGSIGPVNEFEFLQRSDVGSNFRIDPIACQYIYNLGTNSLGAGTYRVQIVIGSMVVGSATFGLS